jgi:hypothetical protein
MLPPEVSLRIDESQSRRFRRSLASLKHRDVAFRFVRGCPRTARTPPPAFLFLSCTMSKSRKAFAFPATEADKTIPVPSSGTGSSADHSRRRTQGSAPLAQRRSIRGLICPPMPEVSRTTGRNLYQLSRPFCVVWAHHGGLRRLPFSCEGGLQTKRGWNASGVVVRFVHLSALQPKFCRKIKSS